jgi:hypothetical protein
VTFLQIEYYGGLDERENLRARSARCGAYPNRANASAAEIGEGTNLCMNTPAVALFCGAFAGWIWGVGVVSLSNYLAAVAYKDASNVAALTGAMGFQLP